LKVSFVGRSGLILLKFDAACGRDEARDLEDLSALAPDREETARALRWLEGHGKLTAGRRPKLKTLLADLGHEDLAGRL